MAQLLALILCDLHAWHHAEELGDILGAGMQDVLFGYDEGRGSGLGERLFHGRETEVTSIFIKSSMFILGEVALGCLGIGRWRKRKEKKGSAGTQPGCMAQNEKIFASIPAPPPESIGARRSPEVPREGELISAASKT